MEAVRAGRQEVRSSLAGPGPLALPPSLHTAELASHFLTNTKHRNILHHQPPAHIHYYIAVNYIPPTSSHAHIIVPIVFYED